MPGISFAINYVCPPGEHVASGVNEVEPSLEMETATTAEEGKVTRE